MPKRKVYTVGQESLKEHVELCQWVVQLKVRYLNWKTYIAQIVTMYLFQSIHFLTFPYLIIDSLDKAGF